MKVVGYCRRPIWSLPCPHGQLTAIRLVPSCFRNSIIFANVGVPGIFLGTLKFMSVRMSLQDTLTMVVMAPDRWGYIVNIFSSRSV